MYRIKRSTVYASQWDAATIALQLAYSNGKEYIVGELSNSSYQIVEYKTYTSGYFDKAKFIKYTSVRDMGWSRGIHKELGDDSPVPVMFKVEVSKRKYTWSK